MHQYEAGDGDTFDYGLAPGESFEPDETGEVDIRQPHIMTVLGPVEPGALGPANLAASFVPRRESDDPAAFLSEIEEAGFAGVNALLDLRPIRSVDQSRAALWLAGRVDLHLIVTTGPATDQSSSENLARIIGEASDGFFDTGVRPGAIVTPTDAGLLDVARAVYEAVGLPLIVDLRRPRLEMSDALELLSASGVAAGNVIVAGDIDTVSRCAAVYDGWIYLIVLEGGDLDGHRTAELHRRLPKSLLIGYDPPVNPGLSRWSGFVEQFPLQLLEAGLDAFAARELLIDRPNDALTIVPPE